jgi:hypothetical protein
MFAIGSFGPGFPGNPRSMEFGNNARIDLGNPEIDAAVISAQVFAAAPNRFQLRWSGLIPATLRHREIPCRGTCKRASTA